MRYTISEGTFGSSNVEIQKEEFEALEAAKLKLYEMLLAEEQYDLVVESYLEFEQTVFNSALRAMVLGNFVSSRNRLRSDLDRRLMNLLVACCSYVDSARHCAKAVAQQMGKINDEFESCKRDHFSYRVMEQLRNIVAHGGVPVHVLTFRAARLDTPDGDFQLNYGIDPKLSIKRIEGRFARFNKEVLEELRSRGGEEKLLPLVREYISDLSHVHSQLRTLCQQAVSDSHMAIQTASLRLQSSRDRIDDLNEFIACEAEGNVTYRKIAIPSFTHELRYFETKNLELLNFSKRFIETIC